MDGTAIGQAILGIGILFGPPSAAYILRRPKLRNAPNTKPSEGSTKPGEGVTCADHKQRLDEHGERIRMVEIMSGKLETTCATTNTLLVKIESKLDGLTAR